MAEKKLWFDLENNRYYLIPNEEAIPEGDLLLYSLAGDTQSFNLEAIAEWAVTKEEITQYIESDAQVTLQTAKSALSNLFSAANPATEPDENDALISTEQLTTWLNLSPEILTDHPAIKNIGLSNIFHQLADLLSNILNNRIDAANQKIKTFRAELLAQDINIHQRIEILPGKIRAWYESSDSQPMFHQMEELLRTTGEKLDTAASTEAGEDVQHILTEFSKDIGDLFAEEQEAPELLYQRARTMARESMEKTWGAKTPNFNFKKLWKEHNRNKSE